MIRIRPVIVALACAVLTPASIVFAQAAGGAAGLAGAGESARTLIENIRGKSSIPGLSAAVFHADRIVWSAALGKADLESDAAASPRTKFRLGSVSKPLTATLAARLARRGDLDLDRDVRSYVPLWPDRQPKVTLRQLLGHLGGIRHYIPRDFDVSQAGGMIDLRTYPDTNSMLALFRDDPLVSKPGEAYSYSTFGYTLAAAAIEGARGAKFADVLRTELLDPLGLADEILVDDFRRIIRDRSAFYDVAGPQEGAIAGTVVRAWPMNSAYKVAGGGMIATAEGVARFGGALWNPALFDRATLDLLFTEQKTNDGQPTGVGLGWRVGRDAAGRRMVHHQGSQQGCRAAVLVYPEQKLAVAVLTNLTNTPQSIDRITQRVAAYFLAAM